MTAFVEISIAQLRASKTNPRTTFPAGSMKELAESIKAHGVLQPLIVRKKGGGYEIVAGERRWRGAKAAKLKAVPCVVRDLTEAQVVEIQLIENLQREGVTPMEEAAGIDRLVKLGQTVDQIAAQIGQSKSYVYGRLQLLKVTPKVREQFEKGTLTAGHAVEISRLAPESQDELAMDATRWHKALGSVAELRKRIKAEFLQPLSIAPWDVNEQKKPGGACAACPHNTANMEKGRVAKAECTSRACWDKNHDAVCEAAGKVTPLSSQQWIEGSHRWTGWRKARRYDVLNRGRYKVVKEGAKGARKGIYVDGVNRGRTTFFVESKRAAASSTGNTKWKRKEAKRKHEAKVEREVLDRMLAEAAKRTPPKLTKELLACSLVKIAGWEDTNFLRKAAGVREDTKDDKLVDALVALPAEALNKAIVGLAVAMTDRWDIDCKGVGLRLIKALKIDRGKMLREVRKAMPFKDPTEKKKPAPRRKA